MRNPKVLGVSFVRAHWKKILLCFFLILLVAYYFCLPDPLFDTPVSTVIEDAEGQLLGAQIASDGQWRFPQERNVPDKFSKALVAFEDKHFWHHPGVNPVSVFRALWQNIRSGKIVSGGSTISMQVIRLARKNKNRTILEKIIEVILASRLELAYSKKEILQLYASNAPFGGNVVGLSAASWRYFGQKPEQLSWAEAATLAVLPNSPSLVYPGKNERRLKAKRDRLILRLKEENEFNAENAALAMQEPLPRKPFPLPQLAPHLLVRAITEGKKGTIVHSTLRAHLQERTVEILQRHHLQLKSNGIYNAAAIVLEVESGKVLAYVGNTHNREAEHGSDVDIVCAPRSTGSILKPFLYEAMLNEGRLLQHSLVPDVPTQIGGYQPRNFNLTYDGAVPAHMALARSLNIPAVKMLQSYGVERFYHLMKKMGMSTLYFPPDHYGLTLILGGAEGTLWDLAGMYASMARVLNRYNKSYSYHPGDYHPPIYQAEEAVPTLANQLNLMDAASIWSTFEAIMEVSRPDEESSWKVFSSSKKVAWKTGTSFGYRDGWAIGTTSKYVVAVWTGNADGEGRPELTGIHTAAPILFDIFSLLPVSEWFKKPEQDMMKIQICTESGYRGTELCENQRTVWISKAGVKSAPCPYHQLIHLDATGKYRVTADCEAVAMMQHRPWFVLPPGMESFYKIKYPSYHELPPFKPGCAENNTISRNMEFIYPRQAQRIYVPVELNEKKGQAIFELAHRRKNATVYWHLDDNYIGTTQVFHKLALDPAPGKHLMTVVDESGESLAQHFEVIAK